MYSPSWARTNDTAVNSRVLCQLSYGGMSQILFSIRYKTTACSMSFRFAQAPRLILTASQILFSLRCETTACSLLILTASQILFSIRCKTTACSAIILNCFADTGNDERLDLNLTSRVGVYLSSRTVSGQVFSARQSLTSVFGMGTGGPSAYFTPTSSHLHLQGLEP